MRQVSKVILASFCFAISATAQEAPLSEKESKEKEVIEPVSKSEFLSNRRAQFNKADTDFDGRLTRHEMNLARLETRKKDYKKRFKDLDTDFSGYLSIREIRDWHEQNTQKRISDIDRQKESFLKKYDFDGNGTISNYEIEQYYEKKKETLKNSIGKNAKNDLNRKDADQSGSVSLEEYIHSKLPKQSFNPLNDNTKMTIQDGNGDGVITRAENEKFISEIFKHLDKNGDNELSEKEQSHNAFRQFKSFHPNAVYLMSDDFPGTRIEFPSNY